jgi:hypothetical protein
MGCLTAPFKLAGCLGLLALLALGWLYRDRLVPEGRALLEQVTHQARSTIGMPARPTGARGRPGTRSLASATAKIDSLNGWRADSVVLTPAEVASLMGQGLAPAFRRELDSLEVELLDDQIAVHARLRTERLPKDVLGPLAGAVRPREPVEARGPLRITGPGVGEWAVRSFRIRDVPVPAVAVERLLGRALGTGVRGAVPWAVPPGVRAVRVRPSGATLFGAPRT